jgi:hypothetical protein
MTTSITKRQLGLLFIAAGILGAVGLLGLDIVRGRFGDFGPTQILAVAGCAFVVVVGLTLLPLGDRPA